jgi:VanZ family protein
MAERPARGWFLAIFWLSLAGCTWFALVPVPPKLVFEMGDVLRHWGAFVWLAFAFRLAFDRRGVAQAAGWLVGYGVLLEILQAMGGTRVGELRDLLVDVVGITTGLLGFWLLGAPVQRVVARVLGRV